MLLGDKLLTVLTKCGKQGKEQFSLYMTKPTKSLCAERRLRSTLAPAVSVFYYVAA